MRSNDVESVVISLDVEKTCESVRWEYLYLVLKRFGFNEQGIGFLNSLYCSPTVRIKINGSSNTLSLKRGCHSFYWAIGAENKRGEGYNYDILIGNTEHKISLYADDVLMTLSNPKVSLAKLLCVLKKFGSYPGCKLNLHKTQTLTFNLKSSENFYRSWKFKLTGDIIKYLGVHRLKDYHLWP